jgi:hypothetical protein
MNKLVEKLTHIGDMLAVPFFILLVIYFYNIKNKTPFEWLLFLFSLSCFFIDVTFSYFYILGKKTKTKTKTKTKN